MFRMGFVRVCVLIGICMLGGAFLVQSLSFGVQDDAVAPQALHTGLPSGPTPTGPPAASVQVDTPPNAELAITGIILAGALILLIRPKRRTVTTTPAQR